MLFRILNGHIAQMQLNNNCPKRQKKWQPSQTAIFLALNLSEAVELSGSSLAQPELQEKKENAEQGYCNS